VDHHHPDRSGLFWIFSFGSGLLRFGLSGGRASFSSGDLLWKIFGPPAISGFHHVRLELAAVNGSA
jgi:hypothetical protein